jgi:hypothetical protein
MINPTSDPADPIDPDAQPLTPDQVRLLAKVRWLMMISGGAMLLGIAVVLGIIGYRVFKAEGSVAPGEMTAMLPKGAKILNTAVADDRVVVTVDVAGALEIRTFDLRSLKPLGRLRFASEP